MKKFCLTTLIAILMAATISAADSPFDTGSKIVGGTAFLSIEKAEGGGSLTTISLMPSVGYFVSRGFMIGGTLSLVTMSSGGASATVFGIGPELRYYFNAKNTDREIKGSINPFLGGFFSYLGESQGDDSITQFGGMLGFNQMLSEQISSEFQFRVFSTSNSTSYGDYNSTTFYFGTGITAFLF